MPKQIRGSDVTVVIPTIPGREELLARAVASVTTQQTQPGKIITVVDTDRHGAAWARNEAIKQVETPWIAWLDDDDELLPNHIKVLVRGANASGADMVYSYAEFVGGEDPLAAFHRGKWVLAPINVPWCVEAEWGLKYGNHIPITYLVRIETVRQVGGFPEPNSFGIPADRSGDCEDYGLILAMLKAGTKFHHVVGVRTWRYYFHGTNTGGRGSTRLHELIGKS